MRIFAGSEIFFYPKTILTLREIFPENFILINSAVLRLLGTNKLTKWKSIALEEGLFILGTYYNVHPLQTIKYDIPKHRWKSI